jgi:hypothetical protein
MRLLAGAVRVKFEQVYVLHEADDHEVAGSAAVSIDVRMATTRARKKK